MKIINLSTVSQAKAVSEAIKVLKLSGLVVYPTETCYGVGVDATNPRAVEKLLAYKGERGGKPIAIAVCEKTMACEYVSLNQTAKNLYDTFLPGPVTVISKSLGKVDLRLQAGRDTLGIRIPDSPLALALIRQFGRPITATSANTSGKKPPYSVSDLRKYTSKKRLGFIDLFLDAGWLPPRPPSTVVNTALNEPTVLRQGEIYIPQTMGTTVVSHSEKETQEIAERILERSFSGLLKKPLIFAIQGELGAGKTQFVKGLAKKLGILATVSSPTFVIIREYPYRLREACGMLYHIDTWRLEEGKELLDLGFLQILKAKNVVAVEWLQKVKPILEKLKHKTAIIWVTIEHVSTNVRKIRYFTKPSA